ncbi:DUF2550 domain-containing protein [Luteimicrobium subarcticum]|uniref:Uncharacterized protein DUF2550 n=1 Tax=Luteimicrobium subarcticum TaxID=620910 RepID=A0A2M8W1J1_9MICO|nr:DUF2550 domain-containing protein [Luteimicrobium subarcticum]PJI84780.1 uncharacterized protein DUF2550 [Luteimicrobium subarcticum]
MPLVWVLLVLLVAALVVLGLGAFRLRSLAARTGTFECGYRTRTRHGAHVSLGFAQFRSERVDWWRCWSLVPRAKRTWRRDSLVVLGRVALDAGSRPDLYVVRCEHDGTAFELTMSAGAYAGLTSWLEAAPPTRFGVVV